jgi:RND family efflux transporter MFP subunit
MKCTQLVTLAAVVLVGCSPKQENKQENEVFPVVHPLVIDTTYTQEYVADIQSLQNVEIRARVKGFIEAIHVDEGKAVKEGQLLFSLNSKAFREELARAKALVRSAQAEAKSAEIDLRNVKSLAEKSVVSASDVELAQSKLDAAQARLEEAASNESAASLSLTYAEIRAPFDGTINRIPNKAGSLVDEGTLLTSISNNKEVFAYFYVSEREYLDFRAQNPDLQKSKVSLVLANNQPYPHKGLIETVDGEIDKTTGNIAFRAKFPNPGDLLKHGSNGKVLLKKELKGAMMVPQRSTFEVQDKTYLYIVDNTSKVHSQAIVPKFRFSDYYVIEPGLNTTDNIVYEGIQHVKDGEKITTRPVSDKQSKQPVN